MTGSHDEQEDLSRWRRMHEYEASAEEARMQESISNYLYFELVIQMLEQGVKGEIDITGVVGSLNELLQGVKSKLEDWLRSAEDFPIAVVYQRAFHDELTDEYVGYGFAEFLCSLLTPERVLNISGHVTSDKERDVLAEIANEKLAPAE